MIQSEMLEAHNCDCICSECNPEIDCEKIALSSKDFTEYKERVLEKKNKKKAKPTVIFNEWEGVERALREVFPSESKTGFNIEVKDVEDVMDVLNTTSVIAIDMICQDAIDLPAIRQQASTKRLSSEKLSGGLRHDGAE